MNNKPNASNAKKLKKWQLLFLLFLIAGTVYVVADQRNTPYQTDDGMVFGTTYHIVYQNDKLLTEHIKQILDSIDNSLSPFNKHSIITKVNNNENVELNTDFINVFNLSQKISATTDGAFDATVAPLVNAWGFGFKNKEHITNHVIDSLKNIVGYRKINLKDNRIVKSNPNIMLDFSAVAKGYACDAVARLFKHLDISNFMIEIGGEVVVQGVNSKNEKWRVGIATPIENNQSLDNTYQAVLSLKNSALATSGNYRNFYEEGGKKYAHTIDPHSGYPVQHSLLSATVIAPSCAMADAYATSFMVMGIEKAKVLLAKHSELKAYLIYTDTKGNLKVWHSKSLKLEN